MINKEIIKIASDTKFEGLKKKFTHKSSAKNSICGDYIKVQLIANNSKIKSMRYETESCILCEASASLLANKIKNFSLKDLKRNLEYFNHIKKTKKIFLPSRFKEFKKLLNKSTINRVNCVILPIEAILKAFKLAK
ncbi:MAG: iron-sulfur cluster assembly scaffold protein [Pelagibacteraceae bacterium]|nr:iron-sulfur cluster assembly scaffold protein [Pelagibacteraceae bacterium]|tara:strand:- start:17468 stop:17875 length:408 start_codon:yes stop_codon:yes gene_type:complete